MENFKSKNSWAPTTISQDFDSPSIFRSTVEPLVTGINYCFFTAPELSITPSRFNVPGVSNSRTGVLMANNGNFLKLPGYGDSIYHSKIVETLAGENGVFMNVLGNRSASLPASDLVLDTIDYSETWNKYKIPMGTSKKDSQISGNFEMMFREDDNLTVFKTIKLWSDYIQGLYIGNVISAYASHANLSDTSSAVFDYMVSLYTFSLKPDGKTIQYWAKYTGIFPTKEPFSIFQSEDGGPAINDKISIDFQFAFKEDLDVAILRDFNLLGLSNNNLTSPTGSNHDGNRVTVAGRPNTSKPHILKVKYPGSNLMHYELRLPAAGDRTYDNYTSSTSGSTSEILV